MENKVLAVVNGNEITEMDLDFSIARFPEQNQNYFRTEEGRKQLLEQIINYELIYNYAKDNNVENEEEYQKQLQLLKRDLLIQIEVSKTFNNAQVNDNEIEEFYNNNKDMFKTEETVAAKHILVDSKEKAEKIIEEIKNGKLFEDAATEYSICPSKAQGGNLGEFGRGRMVPEFEEAAFNLEIGVISEPVKTQFGFHIIKVEDKKQPSVKPLEEVKSMIASNLLHEKQNKEFLALVEKLKGIYSVEMK
ncbi:MAG: peptidylprolyl isomerase [Clostridium argentinense]|uniref:Peptidylprolyl isomerase n=1 Tax=Clostridium faecium TaxID=2762223 RepID=A0ABR8YNF9_9CLOT|nr:MULTISPECIES: peptidylprolyl isomerase [Clostridium]MBD8045779.1 peptidylprolyl isomerase [Clostridium faecium]MBS5825133.1 peptidylprolyl isomerase [Clostridium argentinense]MDU1350973.1 peptidylprolyl isomerase [Clostridium argentinense]